MSDGYYVYKNSELTISFKIQNGGWDINNIVLTNNKTGNKVYGSGYWHKVNMNGVDDDYSGPEGWYEFQTSNCNYSFDGSYTKIVLEKYDCKTNSADRSYNLLRAN